jgi:DNA polymerase, archaea type
MADISSQPFSGGALSEEEALYGFSSDTCIVAVEPGIENGATIYRRIGNAVVAEHVPFQPWFLAGEVPRKYRHTQCTELNGSGLNRLIRADTARAARELRFELRNAGIPTLGFEPVRAYLMLSGQTLFKGMAFNDIHRMQFDIETNGLDAHAEDGHVFMVAVSDNRGLQRILEGPEPTLIQEFVRLVQEVDPDVLEGHNIFGFDLPFLMQRAARHGLLLALGRDGSAPVIGRERTYAIGGNSRPFSPVHVHGRHCIDTYLVVQRFDWAKGALTSYGLKACARQFGFAADDRVELPGAQIAAIYRSNPEKVRIYAEQDAIETRLLADLITPVEFYQTQMMPDSYEQTALAGSGEKINAMFIRAYVRAGCAVPVKGQSRPFPGAYTEVRRSGLVQRVVKADVESLYPSLMLANSIAPGKDTLGFFLPALQGLTRRRMAAKKAALEASEEGTRNYLDGLQNSYKVLINSFYGYLAGPFPWNDGEAAGQVTALGRDTVIAISNRLTADGSEVIEVDTDGVYFVPPPGIEGEAAEQAYVASVGSILPEGVRLAFDGRYRRMISLKTKNYVLESYDGKVVLRGASLRSRSDEPFFREFLRTAIGCLLEAKPQEASALYLRAAMLLGSNSVEPLQLSRRERVTSKTFRSGQKKRLAEAAAGISEGDYVLVYSRTDGSLGIVPESGELSDFTPDIKIYLEKLYRFACRLEPAIGYAFATLFPPPDRLISRISGQGVLDLF